MTEAEYEKSADVASSFEGALNEGASKVFFTRFEVGKRGPPTPGVVDIAYEGLACGQRQEIILLGGFSYSHYKKIYKWAELFFRY